MKNTFVSASLSTLLFAHSTFAQTYSKCNPTQESCPADPALGRTLETSFTSGASSDYTGTGDGISYNSNGAQLAVAKSGDNPTLTSEWYLMFGRVDFVFQAAPGVGMVSSAILLSDDLDEIDWELLGADASEAQTNYFSKGVTGAYNRGGFASAPGSQSGFNTYSIDWTAEQINWEFNGATVRTLTYADANGQYPQTPMQVKIGAWAGGDSTNAPGTIQWAGGPINYADGPFVMQVKSITATDYSTGTEYRYDGTSGSWQSITAVGGSIGSSTGSDDSSPSAVATSPTSTFAGTHAETSAYVTPSTYPWVPQSSAQSSTTTAPPASSYLASLGYDVNGAASTVPTAASSTFSSAPSSAPLPFYTGNNGTAVLPTTMATTTATGPSASMVNPTSSIAPYIPGNAAGRSLANVGFIATACITGVLGFFL